MTKEAGSESHGGAMRVSLGVCVLTLGLLPGCHFHAPQPQPRSVTPTIGPVSVELPIKRAAKVDPDIAKLEKTPIYQAGVSAETEYLLITEPACQCLAAKNAVLANSLDDEGRVPKKASSSDTLRRNVRFHA